MVATNAVQAASKLIFQMSDERKRNYRFIFINFFLFVSPSWQFRCVLEIQTVNIIFAESLNGNLTDLSLVRGQTFQAER